MSRVCRIKQLVVISLTVSSLCAQVPSLINYQGRLTDEDGSPVSGQKVFKVKIFDAQTSGSVLYSEDLGQVNLDYNGVYSFQFGSEGSSQATSSTSVGVADGSANVFNTVLPEEATGIVSITDGTYTWTPETGSTAPTSFIGSYDGTSKTVSAIYIGGAPSGGVEISAIYKTETDGITAALASGNEHWLELSIDGTTQSSRVRILAVPFAQRSNVANKALEGVDSEARSQIQALIQSVSRENVNLGIPFAGIYPLVGPNSNPNYKINYLNREVQAIGHLSVPTSTTAGQGTVSPELGQPAYLSRIVFGLYDNRPSAPRIGWYQINYEDGESVQTSFDTNQAEVIVDNFNKNKRVESVSFWVPRVGNGGATARCTLFGKDSTIIEYSVSGGPKVPKGAIAVYPTRLDKSLTDVSFILELANGKSVTTEANRFVELGDYITSIRVIAKSPDGADIQYIKLLF